MNKISGAIANKQSLEGNINTAITPDITIGTTTTLEPGHNATVELDISSTRRKPIFNFGIPKGDRGTTIVSNINELKSLYLKGNELVRTSGYYEANDNGGASYLIRNKTENDIEDNGSIHFLDNGLVAELITEEDGININKLGAKGDNTSDNTSIIQNAINKYNNIIYLKEYIIFQN